MRLQQIAKIMGIELSRLFCLDEKNVFNLTGTHNTQGDNSNWHVNSPAHTECKQELKTAKKNDYLKQQVSDLREIIDLLKK